MKRIVLTGLAVAVLAGNVWAAEYLVLTDTVPKGQLEAKGELAFARSSSDYKVSDNNGQITGSGSFRGDSTALAVSLRTGLTPKSDIQLNVPWYISYNREAGGIGAYDVKDSGLKDVSVHARYRVYGDPQNGAAVTLGAGALFRASGFSGNTTFLAPSIAASYRDPSGPALGYLGYTFFGGTGSGIRDIHRILAGVRGEHWPGYTLDLSLQVDRHSGYETDATSYASHSEFTGKATLLARVRGNLYLSPYLGGVAYGEEKFAIKGQPVNVTIKGRGGLVGGLQVIYYLGGR